MNIGKGDTASRVSTSSSKGHASFSMTSLLNDEHATTMCLRSCSCSVWHTSGTTLPMTSMRLHSLQRCSRDPIAVRSPDVTPCSGDRIGVAHVSLRRMGPCQAHCTVAASPSASSMRCRSPEVTGQRSIKGKLAFMRFASATPSLRRGTASQVTSSHDVLRSEACAPMKCHHQRAVFGAVSYRDVMALAVLRAPRATCTQRWPSARAPET